MIDSVNTFRSRMQLLSTRLRHGEMHNFLYMQAEIKYQGKDSLTVQFDSTHEE